ncbi:ATP-binding protein [Oceanicaulis sp. LC35]|uniref:sensor histidine kinase n=1 Tax=Oceanicaulis sp. LC35 TaxID=3349635 RepID=UPI003F84E27A
MVLLALLSVFHEGRFGPGGWGFITLMCIVAALLGVLAIAVYLRVMEQLRGGNGSASATPRLQVRFITLFAVAAVVPAVLMAGFQALVLNRGVEFWFAERVNTLVETTADLGNEWPQVALQGARSHMNGMLQDLSYPDAVQSLQDQRIRYNAYLTTQARVRNLPVIYVIDSQATILARSEEAPDTPPFAAPSQQMLQIANEGDISASAPVLREDGADFVRLLLRMPEYEDAYLYSLVYVDFSLLVAAQDATHSFREAIASEQQMRISFFFVYALAAILVFLGAVWLALSAAAQVVSPVSRLVAAAELVRRGELSARVQVARDNDEIAALSRAFNRMTRQLESQRSALLEANAESERRRAFIEAVLTGVSAGVIGLEPDGRISLVNRSAAQLLGREPGELVGDMIDKVLPDFSDVFYAVHRRPDDISERQIEISEEGGATVNLSVRAAQDDDGGVVITFDDVSRLVAAQRSAAWRDVARRIAHEIKNPLTPIQLSAERLKRRYRKQIEEEGLETFDKCVDTIVRQVSDIGRMVDEFSAFARMPAPKMESSDLVDIANSCVFAQRVASPDLQVLLTIQGGPIIIECDSRLVGQALANVLKNAAESVSARMEDEGAKAGGRIAVSVGAGGSQAVIEITDNGLGWPVHDRARLTEPYMTTRAKGTGLGLAIVRRIMEDHGGRLELDDRPDLERGAVVRMVFPLLEPDTDAPETTAQAEA